MPRRRALLVLLVVAAIVAWWLARGRNEYADATLADATATSIPMARPIGASSEADATTATRARWNLAGASISGRVLDETGKAIATADVCATLDDDLLPSALRREPRCTTTGADGRYLLPDVPPVRVVVSASAATYRPGEHDPPGTRAWIRLRPGHATRGIDIVLRHGGVQIHGVVKDIAGGVIEGAIVRAYSGFSHRELPPTRSDAQGAFSLWVAPGGLSVVANAEGYADGSREGVAPGYTFELLLTPESVLGGRVVRASDGTPIAGARVMVAEGAWNGATYTDADGGFRIDRLEPGRYKPAAHTAESFGQVAESILLGLGERVDGIEIRVHPMGVVRGRIVIEGRDETPCEDGRVALFGHGGRHQTSATTELDGAIELPAVPPDTYDVEVVCIGFVAQTRYPALVVGATSPEPQRWTVRPGSSIRGVVVDARGEPIGRARISAQPIGTAARAQQTRARGETDAEGRFELQGMLPGEYELFAEHDDYVLPETSPRLTLSELAPAEEQRIVLERGGTVRGRVVDDQRRPVVGASVDLRAARWAGAGTRTADDGSFVLEAVRPGEVRVVASRGGSKDLRAPGTSDDDVQGVRVEVRAGDVTEVELVVESQRGTIAGKVIDADGAPVDDAFVHTRRESDSAAANAKRVRVDVRFGQWERTPALTDQDGSFELEDLELGNHTLMAMRKGGGEGLIEHVETGARDIVIQLGEGGTLAGTVSLAGGGAPHRFTVTVRDKRQGLHRGEEFFATDGRWRMADLPAGKYVVAVNANEGSTDTNVDLAAGAIEDAIALVLSPHVDVRGVVVDVHTGAPVPGMQVAIHSRHGDAGVRFRSRAGDREEVSDAQGRFLVRAVPAGAVRIALAPSTAKSRDELSYGTSMIAAQVPSGTSTWEMPPLRIAKSRTKRGARAGDLGITLKRNDPETEPEDAVLQIAVIRPGSPAAGSALKVGDVIVAVDGHDVTGTNIYLYGPLVRVSEGEEVTFTTASGTTATLVAAKPI